MDPANRANSQLRKIFLRDHQALTKGLSDIARALEEKDIETAARVAEEIDQVAGPHMAFEEEVLYPALRPGLGQEHFEELYDEHEEGRDAVATLISVGEATALDDATRKRLLGQIETAFDHAISCGALVSRLESLERVQQEVLLEKLEQYRERPCRWSARTTRTAHHSHT